MNESSYWVFLKPITETVDILNDWAEIFKVYMNIDNRKVYVERLEKEKTRVWPDELSYTQKADELNEAIDYAIDCIGRLELVEQAIDTIYNISHEDTIKDKAMRNAAAFIQNAVDGEPPEFEEIKGTEESGIKHVGKWKQVHIGYMSPGGTPSYACPKCGGGEHLHGAEFPYKKLFCPICGQINVYPWEKFDDI